MKLNNISLLRLLLCFGIFVYHYFDFFITADIFYYLPSPLLVFSFAIISAFLYSNKQIENPKAWLIKNFTKLLLPALIYMALGTILLIIVGMFLYSFDFKQVFANFNGYRVSNGESNFVFGNLWFLGSLLVCYFATPFCYRFSCSQYKMKGYIAFLSIVVVVATLELLFYYFCPVFLVYVVSYFLGKRLFTAISNLKFAKSHMSLIVGGVVTLICSCLAWYLYVGNFKHSLFDFHIKILHYLTLFSFSLSLTFIFLYIFKFINRYNISIFKITDKYSFPFYLTHQLYMAGTLCFYALIPNWYFFPLFMLASVTAVIVILISDSVLKLINKQKRSALKDS